MLHPFGMVVNVSGWSKYSLKYEKNHVACPVRMLRIRMTGD